MTSSRTTTLLLLLAAAGLGFSACGSDDAASSGDDVSGVVWQLTELRGDPVPEGVTPTLEFDGSRVAGNTGCNNYNSDATFDDGSVTIAEQIVTTMMACQPPASDVETMFLEVLPTVTGFAVDGDTLSLSAGDDTAMVFSAPG